MLYSAAVKTILHFQSGLSESNTAKLEGVYRYAKGARWRVQVVSYGEAVIARQTSRPQF